MTAYLVMVIAMAVTLVLFWIGTGTGWAILAGFVCLAAGQAVVWPRR